MAVITVPGMFLTGDHASRPAASAVGGGSLYSCTDHDLIYQSDTSSWTTWATLTPGGSGAPDDAEYVTYAANASLSAEVVRPELRDNATAGTPIDFTSPTLDTSVTRNAVADMQGRFNFPANTTSYADVASSIGTGDFDLRCRITSVHPGVGSGNTGLLSLLFAVTDSSRTATTKLCIKTYGMQAAAAAPYICAQVGNTEAGAVVRPARAPYMFRMTRSGTSVTYYASFNEGVTWTQLHSATSSLDIAKVALIGVSNVTTQTVEAMLHWVRSV